MEGYVKIYRSISEWRWYQDPAVAHLFIHLLIKANYTDTEWHDITIRRGQLISSRKSLSKETGLTEKVIRRCIKALRKTGEITVDSTTQYSLITIVKYSEYQGETTKMGQAEANERPTLGQRKATNKEREKQRKEEVSSPYPPQGGTNSGKEQTYGVLLAVPEVSISQADSTIPKGYEKFTFSFVSEHFKEAFYKWLDYKNSEWGFRYKNERSVRTCYNNLIRLSDNDFQKAMLIVEQSIGNGWKGLFKYKNTNYDTYDNNGYRSREDLFNSAVRIIGELRSEGKKTLSDIPVV